MIDTDEAKAMDSLIGGFRQARARAIELEKRVTEKTALGIELDDDEKNTARALHRMRRYDVMVADILAGKRAMPAPLQRHPFETERPYDRFDPKNWGV